MTFSDAMLGSYTYKYEALISHRILTITGAWDIAKAYGGR